MTQENLNLAELQELKEQFNLLNIKLEKQRIINEEMIKESIKEKLSHIEKWYRRRFCTSLIAAPIAGIVFISCGEFGFGALILLTGLMEFILNRKALLTLDIRNLPNMNMTEAAEKVIAHKKQRSMGNRILALPLIALIVWTILIAGGYTWNPKIIALTLFTMGVSVSWSLHQMRQNQKRLNSAIEQLKKL